MLLRPEKLSDAEKEVVGPLRRLSPEVARTRNLALGSIEVGKERRADELRGWLVEAQRSEIPEFATFAQGLASDLSAVRAALEYEWSNGQVEGRVHWLKLLKRQI